MVLIMTKLYTGPLLGNYIYYFPHYIDHQESNLLN